MKRHNSVTWQDQQTTPKIKRTMSHNITQIETEISKNNEPQASFSNIKKLLNIIPDSEPNDEKVSELKENLYSNYENEQFSDAMFNISGKIDNVYEQGEAKIIKIQNYEIMIVDEWKEINFYKGMEIRIFECDCCPKNGFVCGRQFTLCDGMMLMIEDRIISVTMLCESFTCLTKAIMKEKIMDIRFGYSHPSLVVGVIMHTIIEKCMKEHNFTLKFIVESIKREIGENVKLLYACNMTTKNCMFECTQFIKNIFKIKECDSFGDVLDLEKRIVSHKFNIVGNIDAVLTKKGKRIPLEIKTGKRADYRHQAQSILYLMMMHEKYTDCDDYALLLYANDYSVKKVNLKHNEAKSLLILRNKIASFHYAIQNKIENEINFISFPNLFKTSCICQNIEVCKTVEDIFNSDGFKAKFLRDQWASINEEEENQRNTCLIEAKFIKQNDRELTIQINQNNVDSLSNYIEIFNENKTRICFGRIFSIENEYFHITLNSNINLCCYLNVYISNTRNEIFFKTMRFSALNIAYSNNFLDWNEIENSKNLGSKPELSQDKHLQTIASWNGFESFSSSFQNIDISVNQSTEKYMELFTQRHSQTQLTKLKTGIPEIYKQEFLDLNCDQRSALFLALNCEKYKIIHGFPGTGKSKVITLLIKILCHLKKKVLLICYTNLAIDNILNRLSVKYYRALKDISVFNTTEKLKSFLDGIELVAGTCYSFTDIAFIQRRFDMCVVDEASQQHFLLSLIPISLSDRFVLVGDHLQLKPLTVKDNSLKISLFEYLAKNNVSELRQQYRMADCIMALSNYLFYDKKMKGIGRKGYIEFIDLNILDKDIKAIISRLNGIDENLIVVLCYFNSTVYKLRKMISCKVETIDRFQGSEAETIIVVFDPIIENSIMDSKERLNVALTRARSKLILLGDRNKMMKIPIFSEMFGVLKRII